MSESDNNTATGRLGGPPRIARVSTQQTPPDPYSGRSVAPVASPRRWNIGRDLTAGVLLVIALFLPWNLYFGNGIPNSGRPLFALLLLTTLLSLGSIAAGYRCNPGLAGRLRLGLNAPYVLLVVAFVVFDVVQTGRYGGSVKVPGGVGPGAWLGIAGSLLCAQPAISETAADDDRFARWLMSARIVGYASMVGATLSFVFVLYWRVKYALPGSAGSAGFGKENAAVIVTAVVYGVVALAAVIVAARWIVQGSTPFRLATVALGASTLVAGLIVWSLPIGREIDAFHGIAQNTSTAGVGFEGYLAWAAAAAIFTPLALLRSLSTRPIDKSTWREAARKGLLLIAVWCVGSVVMRITGLLVAVSLNFPFSRYDSMALAAFDVVTAVLAVWLRVNLINRSLPVRLVSSLCGALFTLTIARIVVGIALAPRFLEPQYPVRSVNPVYGNNLAQQITSTFDVALCGLALCILAVVIITGQPGGRSLRPRPRARSNARKGVSTAPPAASPPSQAETTQLAAGTPKIYRTPKDSTPEGRHRM